MAIKAVGLQPTKVFLKRIVLAAAAITLLLQLGQPTLAEETLSVGRMSVELRPEYDDQGILAVYDGRFADSTAFPVKTSFLIPKDSVISDACSVSPRGQHFCQLYRLIEREDGDEVVLTLPYPNFYLSFHTQPLNNEAGKRNFLYSVKANHPIETLEVNIQQPLRSADFSLAPTGAKQTVVKGFNHFSYSFDNVGKGGEKYFSVSYKKKDRKPSMEIKYAPMGETALLADSNSGSPYDTQRMVKLVVYLLFGSGGIAVGAFFWFAFSRKKR